MTDSTPENILNDREPVCFKRINDQGISKSAEFELYGGAFRPNWLQNDVDFNMRTLHERIEPWLTALFQSEHLSLLAGSGLSTAVSLIATSKTGAGMGTVEFPKYDTEINAAASSSAKAAGRDDVNIEDQIRVAN